MANKSNKSAVVIIPPKSAWDQIQNIRSKYDKAYDRWMPHINLIYPFAPDSKFQNLLPRLKEELKEIAPFTISFTKDSIGYFEHGQKCGLWLKPLLQLQQSTQKASLQSQGSSVLPHNTKTNICTSQKKQQDQPVINSNKFTPSLDNLRYAVWLPEDNMDDTNPSVIGLHNLRNAIWQPGESDSHSISSKSDAPQKVAINKAQVAYTRVQPSIQYSEQSEGNSVDANDEFHSPVMGLQKILAQLYPNFNDLSVINEKGFQPHLTLGQFKPSEIQKVVNDLKQNWKAVNFTVDEIHLISRRGFVDPFEIKESVALGS